MATGEYNECMDWIFKQQEIVESMKYGKNQRAVKDSLDELQTRSKIIKDYQKEVDKVTKKVSKQELKETLDKSYTGLRELCTKKLNNLVTLLEIVTLEDTSGTIANEFDLLATDLVRPEQRVKVIGQQTGGHLPGFVSPAAQESIFATRDSWRWMQNLMKCTGVHLKNAAQYHQFFQYSDEMEDHIIKDVDQLTKIFSNDEFKGDYADAKRLLQELDDLIKALRQWETKTSLQWEQATRVLPVHLRTENVSDPTPIRALCEYETNQIHVRDGEDLLLLDSTDPNSWKVRNCRGQEAEIPAVVCLIPGPFAEAIEAAVRLRLKLITVWTDTMKIVGSRLIDFLLVVFKEQYSKDEIDLIQSIPEYERNELLRIMDYIEGTLKVHWLDDEDFQTLQERLTLVREIINEVKGQPGKEKPGHLALIVQMSIVEKLMDKYKLLEHDRYMTLIQLILHETKLQKGDPVREEVWRDWLTYKSVLETVNPADLLLVVGKWEELSIQERSDVSRMLDEDWKRIQEEEERERLAALEEERERKEREERERREREELERLERERIERERNEKEERERLERLERERLEMERLEKERKEREERERLERERLERLERERLEKERKEREERERLERERLEREERERLEKERLEKERKEKEEKERLERERKEQEERERLERERLEKERLEKERLEKERLEKERLEKERLEKERLEKERLEKERLEKERLERERLERERKEKEERERLEKERKEKEERERLEKERLERERREKEEQERIEREERERKEREERERKEREARERLERERLEKERKEKEERERKEKEERERKEREEKERKEREEKERFEREERERKEREEKERLEREERERKEREEQERLERERKEKEEQERKEREEKERLEREERDRLEREMKERLQREAMERALVGMSSDEGDEEFETSSESSEYSRKKVETSEIASSAMEEKKTLVITAVFDPRTGTKISLNDAIKDKIIVLERGMYVNPKTGEELFIPIATNQGLIEVGHTRVRRGKEKKSTIGIITVSDPDGFEEDVTYAVKSVMDTRTKRHLKFQDAVQRGIIIKEEGAFLNTATEEIMFIGDAIERKYIVAQIVKDPRVLDVDPENKMVAKERVRTVMRSLSAISALKKAASMESLTPSFSVTEPDEV